MRAGEVLSEAWRDIRSGHARVAAWTALAMVTLGLVAAVDARAVVDIVSGAHEFRSAGSSIQVLDAPGAVDGQRCESLAQVDGIVSSGALRQSSEVVRPAALPSTGIRLFEASAGLGDVLKAERTEGGGAWLPWSLAGTLGLRPGDVLPTSDGPVEVSGRFDYPADGRAATLEHVVVAPVPAVGSFDACWAEVWPSDEAIAGLLRFSLVLETEPTQVRQGQLNARLGQGYDPAALFDARPTRWAAPCAALAGVTLGASSVRARRLELASALHAGVPRHALTAVMMIESGTWAAAGTVVASPLLWWVATDGTSGSGAGVWAAAVLTVVGGAVAIPLGAAAGVASTRESHLFRYFKDR